MPLSPTPRPRLAPRPFEFHGYVVEAVLRPGNPYKARVMLAHRGKQRVVIKDLSPMRPAVCPGAGRHSQQIGGCDSAQLALSRSGLPHITETPMTRTILIGAPIDDGQRRPGCVMGPAAYRVAGIAAAIRDLGHGVTDWGDVALPELTDATCSVKLARLVSPTVSATFSAREAAKPFADA